MADSGERNRSQRKLKLETSSTGDSGDFISSMPDEILHHIISFNTTKLAVKTSVLSRRWRHVWCETSCLSFRGLESTARGINQTLISYRSLKLTSFRLDNAYYATAAREINPSMIPLSTCSFYFFLFKKVATIFFFASSFSNSWTGSDYTCPHLFFFSSSLEQLDLKFALIPICTTVSWKILRNLTLKSTANILSGCPILETLELIYCHGLPPRLDLSKSLNLRRLEIKWTCQSSYPVEIIAPHIHYLKLSTYKEPCTLVYVSSVTRHGHGSDIQIFEGIYIYIYILPDRIGYLLPKILIFMLSLAQLCGRPFPMLRVQTLIVKTMAVRSAIPGITRLLQNSPVLKKLIARATCSGTIKNKENQDFGYYLSQPASKLFTSLMEVGLRNSKTLEMMVVQFKSTPLALECFAQLLQMPPTLPQNNNVSIVLNPSNYSLIASVSLI
ncbi:unnamed protein product [Brassica rapa subsp. trilocularis]